MSRHEQDDICEEVIFDDNHRAAEIYGPNNMHLSLLEKDLNVTLRSRGNELTICGSAENVHQTQEVLRKLWDKQENDITIDAQEVTAALRFSHKKQAQVDSSLAFHTKKKQITPRTPMQAQFMQELKENELCFAVGPAGTGKTWLAVARAVEAMANGEVERIILSRPALEAGEKLGFLPGDMQEKVDPYLRPLYDAMHDMMPKDFIERKIASGEIEIAPLAFMRGRSLKNAYIILDEAQNTTAAQMKMFLTRFGEGSRMIVTGDLSQVDLPRGVESGLLVATQKLAHIESVSVIEFGEEDVVRHDLVARIIKAW
ncbi:MAG: PhoH family protein [Alphaproteobacteria bacterium]